MREVWVSAAPRVRGMIVVVVVSLALVGCVRAPQARARGWWSVRTEHVRLSTDVERERAADAAWLLEDLHRALGRVFPECARHAREGAIDIVMIARDGEFDELGTALRAGYFLRAEDTLVAVPARVVMRGSGRGRRATRLFVHELTHRFVHACYPDAPAWLHEGLAGYHELLEVRGRSIFLGRGPYRFQGNFIDGVPVRGDFITLVPARRVRRASALVALTGAEFYDADHDEAVVSYASAFAFVHLLSASPHDALRRSFADYLALLSRREVPESDAFAATVGRFPIDELLRRHVRDGVRGVQRVAYEPPRFAEPRVEPAEPGQVHLLLAELYLRSAREGREAIARAHLDAIVTPELRARAALLDAAVATGRARRELVHEATRLAPDDLDVLRARALLLSERPHTDAAEAVARTLGARTDLRAADLSVLALLRLARGEAPEALAAAAEAVRRDPSSTFAHMQLARALDAVGWEADALRELRAIVSSATHHDPEIADEAAALMAAIRRRER